MKNLREAYSIVKELCLIHISGETINKEATMPVIPAVILAGLFLKSFDHGDFDEFEGDIGGNDPAFANIGANEFALFRALADLLGT